MRRQLSDYEDVEHPSTSGRDDACARTRQLFWEGFDYAVRQHCIREYLHNYRGMPAFVDLVAEAEQKVKGMKAA